MKRKLDFLWSDSFELKNFTTEDIQLLRETGCMQVSIGVETTSKKINDHMKREFAREKTVELLEALEKAGIWTRINVIVGFPHQTTEEVEKDVEFLTEVHHLIDHLNISEFRLYPKTICGEDPEKFGIKIINNDVHQMPHRQKDNPNTQSFCYQFGEIDGRNWEELVRFTKGAFNDIISTRDCEYDALSSRNPLIYLLYENFGFNKAAIREFIWSYLRACSTPEEGVP
jgi:tRNA A37 methylthiotransferase MiaB